jgi:hypothetical protein
MGPAKKKKKKKKNKTKQKQWVMLKSEKNLVKDTFLTRKCFALEPKEYSIPVSFPVPA